MDMGAVLHNVADLIRHIPEHVFHAGKLPSAGCAEQDAPRGKAADFYPNPVTDFLNIRTGEASSSASVQVLAPNGATVLTGSDLTVSPFAPVQIDMTSLPGGMYTVIFSYTAADGSTKSTTTDIAKL